MQFHSIPWTSYKKFLFSILVLECILICSKGYSFEKSYDNIYYEAAVKNPDIARRYNLTISDKKKFVWFRVAKVGTRSIYKILTENQVPFSIDTFNIPFKPKNYKKHFKFGFVRNPWARVVSCYFNKVVTQAHRAFRDCFGKDFDYFVDYINKQDLTVADAHIRLQTKLVPINLVNFIGRIENFKEDIEYIANTLGLQISQVPQKNKSNHEHYSKYYTPRTRKIIAKKYKDDIKAFGYHFETE